MSNLRVMQVNLNRNAAATESALQLAVELDIGLVLVQEPWLTSPAAGQSTRSINHPSFGQILPACPPGTRPRTLAYFSRSRKLEIDLRPDLLADPDVQVLDVALGASRFQVLNVYNQSGQAGDSPRKTFQRLLAGQSIRRPTIVVGDFNEHHTWWDPHSPRSRGPANWSTGWRATDSPCSTPPEPAPSSGQT